MGGPGKPNTTTPEHLFAAGYAACLGGAIDYQANQLKLPVQNAASSSPAVTIGQSDDRRVRPGGGEGTRSCRGVPRRWTDAEKSVVRGRPRVSARTPRRIKGNVDVKLNVTTV